MIEKEFLHPDALYEEPYEEHILDTDEFNVFPSFSEGTLEKGGFSLKGKGTLLAEAVNSNVIRVRISSIESRFSPSLTEQVGLIYVDCTYEGISANKDSIYTLETGNLRFSYDKESGEFCFSDNQGCTLLESESGVAFGKSAEFSGESSLSYFKLDPKEHFFGFGGRIMHPDRTNTSVDIFTEKVGRLSGDYGGCPVPFFISTKGYGFFFNNPWPHVYFDMGRTYKNKWFLHAPGGSFDIFVIKGNSMDEILKEFTAITGRISVPKKWNLGFWCSSVKFFSAEEVEEAAVRMHKEGYPCDAMVMDCPWRAGKIFLAEYSKKHNYTSGDFDWHPDFGDGKKLVQKLDEEGMKLVLHLNSRSFKPETYIPAIEKGLLRKQGQEVIPVVLDKKGEKFYKDMLAPRVEDGVTQWWTDHADRVSGELREGIPSRNLFGSLWNKMIAELMNEHGINNHMSLTRGGGIGGQTYSLPWAGDTRFGMDYFLEDIRYMLNGSMAGYSLIGYDLGGFFHEDSNASEEEQEVAVFEIENVCRRICQSILFVPIPRVHSGQASPKLPWNFPEESRQLLKDCLKKRYSWIPYIYSCAIASVHHGSPIVSPLAYKHMKDLEVYGIEDEFYMGDTLLFAPVVTRNTTKRDVYLPEGRWMDIWTGECFDGKTVVTRNTPLFSIDGLPIFAKGGCAMVSVEPGLTVKEDIPECITIEFYGTESSITLWEGVHISNTFNCEKDTVYLENNTTDDRVYNVIVYDISGDKVKTVFKKTFEVKALGKIIEGIK